MTAPHTTAHQPSSSTPAAVSHGAILHFETAGPVDATAAGLRIRPDEDTLLRVIHGTLRLTIGNVEHLLSAGGEAIIRAGHAHRLAGVGGEARYVMGFRAAATR
jgi:mannose-6-phosphate isomerase-like protein (cupin superfamily)